MNNSGIFRGYQNETRLKSMFQAGEWRLLEPKRAFFPFFQAICKTEKSDFMRDSAVPPIFQNGLKNQVFGFFGDFSGMNPL